MLRDGLRRLCRVLGLKPPRSETTDFPDHHLNTTHAMATRAATPIPPITTITVAIRRTP